MNISILGIDIAKNVFQIHGTDKNGRHMSAWLGLVPRQSSSGHKQQLLGISKRGDKYYELYSFMVLGQF